MSKVYFAHCGQYVKIGFSSYPERRARRMFGGSILTVPADLDTSQPVHLLRVIAECIVKDERALHDRFAEYRAAGEWFRATDDLLAQIADLDYTPIRKLRNRARRENRPRKWGKPHDHTFYTEAS